MSYFVQCQRYSRGSASRTPPQSCLTICSPGTHARFRPHQLRTSTRAGTSTYRAYSRNDQPTAPPSTSPSQSLSALRPSPTSSAAPSLPPSLPQPPPPSASFESCFLIISTLSSHFPAASFFYSLHISGATPAPPVTGFGRR